MLEKRGCRILAVFVAAILADRPTIAQQPEPIQFEVASVKPNRSGEVSSSIYPLIGGTFTAENAELRDLIKYAYQLSDVELVGEPDWTERERFDIRARARADLPTLADGLAPERLMLQALLADRFKLAVRRETREVPIYALVRAPTDGRSGLQLRASRTDCAALKKAAGGSPPRSADGSVLCSYRNSGTGLFTANGLSMQVFARFLSGQVRRVVIDRTSLSGGWDIELKWTPGRMRDAAGGSTLTDAPTLFTALQEQLGLKLESTTGPVEMTVVTHVERPTAD